MRDGAISARLLRLGTGLSLGLLLAGCSVAGLKMAPAKAGAVAKVEAAADAGDETAVDILAYAGGMVTTSHGSPEVNGLIAKYALIYGVPESLIHRVVRRESTYNPRARNGPYWGLMQIRHDTARTMGYRGDAEGLLDADINLRYAVKYLRGAWLVGRGSEDAAVRFYSRGYYYDAKRLGLLEEAGLRN